MNDFLSLSIKDVFQSQIKLKEKKKFCQLSFFAAIISRPHGCVFLVRLLPGDAAGRLRGRGRGRGRGRVQRPRRPLPTRSPLQPPSAAQRPPVAGHPAVGGGVGRPAVAPVRGARPVPPVQEPRQEGSVGEALQDVANELE